MTDPTPASRFARWYAHAKPANAKDWAFLAFAGGVTALILAGAVKFFVGWVSYGFSLPPDLFS